MLCVVINLTRPGTDQYALRQILAPLVRDSCMYVGISGTVESIPDIHTGFQQADIALRYILQENSSQWIVPFQECALAYIRGYAAGLHGHDAVHPILPEGLVKRPAHAGGQRPADHPGP